MGRIVLETIEEDRIVVFVRNLEPYESVRILISTALSLLEGRADVTFNEGSPLTDEEEREIMNSLVEGSPQTGGQRDN